MLLAAMVLALPLLGGGCLFPDDFSLFHGALTSDGGNDDAGVADLSAAPTCSCTPGMTSTMDCDPCAHRECDGCHFGACVLNTDAECEYRGGALNTPCPTTRCGACAPPRIARRACTAQCTWAECQCCSDTDCRPCS